MQLIQLFVSHFLISDIGADRLLVSPNGRNEVAPRPTVLAQEIAQLGFHVLRNPDRTFPFQIKKHVKAKTPLIQLSTVMKRTPGALRQKARSLDIALSQRR